MLNRLTLNGSEYELVALDTIAGCAEDVPILVLGGEMFAAKAIVDKRWPVDEKYNVNKWVSPEGGKELKILSFDYAGKTFHLMRDGKYRETQGHSPKPTYSINDGRLNKVPNDATITSVKRISDGEVFSVGDYVDMINAHKITRIIIGGAPQNHERNENLVWLSTSDAPYHHGVDLMVASKYKPKSIFKTNDGIEYFEGQENNLLYSVVPKATWETRGEVSVLTAMSRQNSNWIYFSTKEAMDKYIFAYRPYLSYEDVIKFILQEDVDDTMKGLMVMRLTDFLKQKVNGLQ